MMLLCGGKIVVEGNKATAGLRCFVDETFADKVARMFGEKLEKGRG